MKEREMSHTRIVPNYTLVRPDGTHVATVAEHEDNSDEITIDTQEALTAQESELLIEAIRRLHPLPKVTLGPLPPLTEKQRQFVADATPIGPGTVQDFTFTRDGE